MVIIGNHEYEFQWTMPVWEKFEEKVCLLEDFDVICSSKGRLRKIALAAAIMSVEQPMSEEKIFRELEPADVNNLVGELQEVIRAGMKMNVEKDEDKVVDEVLEEIEKKETGAD